MKNVSLGEQNALLTEAQKKTRLRISRSYLDLLRQNTEQFVSRFMTIDETWLHHYGPETEKQTMTWKRPSSPTPKNIKPTHPPVRSWALFAGITDE